VLQVCSTETTFCKKWSNVSKVKITRARTCTHTHTHTQRADLRAYVFPFRKESKLIFKKKIKILENESNKTRIIENVPEHKTNITKQVELR
jgi:hypothetical protein